MKTNEKTTGVVIGKTTEVTKDVCRLLAQKGISTVIVQKEMEPDVDENMTLTDQRQWSGQPGKDLFFNGWKLLF